MVKKPEFYEEYCKICTSKKCKGCLDKDPRVLLEECGYFNEMFGWKQELSIAKIFQPYINGEKELTAAEQIDILQKTVYTFNLSQQTGFGVISATLEDDIKTKRFYNPEVACWKAIANICVIMDRLIKMQEYLLMLKGVKEEEKNETDYGK